MEVAHSKRFIDQAMYRVLAQLHVQTTRVLTFHTPNLKCVKLVSRQINEHFKSINLVYYDNHYYWMAKC